MSQSSATYHEDAVLSVARAASVADCHPKTVQRAYLAGHLAAHRRRGSRRVYVRFSDLREWMLGEQVEPRTAMVSAETGAAPPIGRVEFRPPRPAKPAKGTGNRELLLATRARLAAPVAGLSA